MTFRFVLASASSARRSLLSAAGVAFEVDPARIDEDEIKASLLAEKAKPLHVAEVLGEAKATRISMRRPQDLVLGADQVLELDGEIYDKPKDLIEAAARLALLSGKWHSLPTAAVMAQTGAPVWRQMAAPKLKMRDLSKSFIAAYIEQSGPEICSSVGAYMIESVGAQLFEKIEGDYFSVLGLPLLPVLAYLRTRKVLAE